MKLSWSNLFEHLFQSVSNEILESSNVCPTKENIFKCFKYFEVLETKVVICGQDPYHTKGVANGLAFDVSTTKQPPSLKNIFKEVLRVYPDSKCNIEEWARQGVLMLNRALTVELNKPNSHTKMWKPITNKMIQILNDYWKQHNVKVVFLLWGNNAKELEEFIDTDYHYILKHTHPSPLSRKPFIGNGHFDKSNDFLEQNNRVPIQW